MTKKGLLSLVCCLLASTNLAFAQSPQSIADGTAFANSLKPVSPGQIVNPAAVDPKAWTGNVVPAKANTSNMGTWSTPNTSNSTYIANQKQGAVGALGIQTQVDCKNYVPTGNAEQDQRCAAINFMANNCIQPTSAQSQVIGSAAGSSLAGTSANCQGTFGNGVANQFSLTPADGLLVTQFKSNSANIAAAGGGCVTQTIVTRPATYATHQCIKNQIYDQVSCTQDLDPMCAWVGAPITSISTSGPVSIGQVAPGLYNYSESLSGGGVNPPIGASITFNLDGPPSQGSYISARSSSLDDTGVIVVNGVVVYFGHPNSGAQWYYPTFGTTPAFVRNYYWNAWQGESWNYDPWCDCYYYQPAGWVTRYANFKLANFCPYAGFVETSNKTGAWSSWCNEEGYWVGNSVEGNGYRGISVAGQLPLVQGSNTIELYWGTEGGNYSGGIGLSGQIYNVAPICSGTWIDRCGIYENSAGAMLPPPQ